MRTIDKQTTVAAPIEEVWTAWTTAEGVTSFSAPEAKIELRHGGPYEWYFMLDAPEGLRGAEGCTIQAYLPPRLLAFTWNSPPTIPALRALGPCSHVIVELEDRGAATGVTLTHVIEGEGEDWDAYIAYFDRAWGMVLAGLAELFGSATESD